MGEIETAAGLVPRSGGLYKHFASKRALIDAALVERFGKLDAIDEQVELMPLGDLRSEVTMLAHLALDELEGERDLCRLVMKEGDRFPELADAFHAGIVDRGHRIAAGWLTSRAKALGRSVPDVDATAQVMTGALVAYVLEETIFGERNKRIGRERLIAAWTELVMSRLEPDREE